MNALLAAEFAKRPVASRPCLISHPVKRIVISVDASGSKTFMDVYGTLTMYPNGTYQEMLKTSGDKEVYRFNSLTMPDMDVRAAEWAELKVDRMFGHAKKRQCTESIQALNPLDIYGFEDCMVCYERTVSKTECKHPLCLVCSSRLQDKCPLRCRRIAEESEDDEPAPPRRYGVLAASAAAGPLHVE